MKKRNRPHQEYDGQNAHYTPINSSGINQVGRRLILPESSQQHSMQTTTPSNQPPQEDYRMNSKRTSQGIQKRGISNYATQVIDQSDRSPIINNKGHKGHRKNQPVPIDTFNIVSNRRKSLVKQVNEANANSDAIINKSY